MDPIVYCTDSHYWMHLVVSVFSLLKNNQTHDLHIVVLHDIAAIESDPYRRDLAFLRAAHPSVTIEAVHVDPTPFRDAPTGFHFSRAMYYRFLIANFLPPGARLALYLDCDTVVTGDLAPLFATKLGDNIVAAAQHIAPPTAQGLEFRAKLGLPQGVSYFNSGVLLINLERWRQNHIEAQALDFMHQNAALLRWPDQDCLNAVLGGRWRQLESRFNFLDQDKLPGIHEHLPRAVVVLHYNANLKPWHYLSRHPYRDVYWEYLKQTPYAGFQPVGKTMKSWVKRQLDDLTGGKVTGQFVDS